MYILFKIQEPEKRVAKGGGWVRRSPDSVSDSVSVSVTPPRLSVRFTLHALLSGLIKHHVQALFYPLKTMSCFGATLPLPSSPPFPLLTPLPSSFSDSSPKACRDMKPLVFKRDNNNSKVILIIDSHLEHGPIFKC